MSDLIKNILSQAVQTPEATQTLIGRLLEQQHAPCNVRHLFGPGVYMCELKIEAGAVIVSRSHRSEYDSILARGALTLFNGDGTQTQWRAPAEFRAGPGREVVRVDEDTTFVSVYHTAERDMEVLERQIFDEPAPQAPLTPIEPDGDFEAMLAEMGATAATMRGLSERIDDVCPFPDGVYKCKVGRSRIEGKGLIATADIPVGEFISPATWEGKRTPAARYTNHAKNPNAGFIYSPEGIAWLASIRPIQGSRGGVDGEEITVDYRRNPHSNWKVLA